MAAVSLFQIPRHCLRQSSKSSEEYLVAFYSTENSGKESNVTEIFCVDILEFWAHIARVQPTFLKIRTVEQLMAFHWSIPSRAQFSFIL